MSGGFDEQVGAKRICYSCGNSYSNIVRFCPRDSADLDYLPQRLEDLARDFKRPKRWLAIAVISVFVLILAGFLMLNRIGSVSGSNSSELGVLTVRTTPAGARVYLDGSQVGVSPVRLLAVPTGFHEVRAVFPGYSDGMAQVEILPSATQKLVWELSPLPSTKTRNRYKYLVNFSPAERATASETSPGESI